MAVRGTDSTSKIRESSELSSKFIGELSDISGKISSTSFGRAREAATAAEDAALAKKNGQVS
ncbi:MAG: hypothetical protein RLZZ437_3183 [Pseudomonadota bacterium]